MNAKSFIEQLASSGRYTFTTEVARAALSGTADSVKLALNRLRRKGEINSPMRGFWVVVPPEYRRLGCLPAEQFIPALMSHLGLAYYAGLLTAAQFHGAAHHRPQTFQVMVEKPRRQILCGQIKVDFHVRKNLTSVPVQPFNTPRGPISASTPEATAYDLIGYEAQIGGLNAAATVLADLAEKLDPQKLAVLAPQVPAPCVQRLGFVLEALDAPFATGDLRVWVKDHVRTFTSLQPGSDDDNNVRSADWKLILNMELEPDA